MRSKLAKLLIFAVLTVVLVAFASFNAFAADYSDDGTGMDALIETALTDATNEDVNITLNGTWTFTDHTVFGDRDSIPDHTITITGGTIETAGYMPCFSGHFVFENVAFVGTHGADYQSRTNADAQNGMYFPENASCVIGSGCTGAAERNERINLAGDDLTVHGGKFFVIAAQMYGNKSSNYVTLNDPTITIDGDTEADIVCGLGYNNAGNITGSATLNVGGAVNITEFLVAGGYCSNTSARGGTLTVATTGDSTIRNVTAVVGASGCTTKSAMPVYSMTLGSTAALSVDYVSTALITGSEDMANRIYVDSTIELNAGLTVKKTFYCNVMAGTGGGTTLKIMAGGKVTTTVNGAALTGSIYAGSCLRKEGSSDAADTEIIIKKITSSGGIYGGSYIAAANGVHSGTTTVRFLAHAGTNNKYGGSSLNAAGAKQTGDSYVYIGGDTTTTSVTVGNTIHTGGYIPNATGVMEGKSHTYIQNIKYSGALYGGAYVNCAGTYGEGGTSVGAQTGDSEVVIISGTCTGTIYGGDRLAAAGSIQDHDSSVTVQSGSVNAVYGGALCATATSTVYGNSALTYEGGSSSGNNFAGANLSVVGAKMIGDSELTVNAGTISSAKDETTAINTTMLSAGCRGTATVLTDADPDDKITGGFAHVGNVKGNFNGGTMSGRKTLAGFSVNVDGSVEYNLNTGTFTEYNYGSKLTETNSNYFRMSLLSDAAPNATNHNTVSITGDLKVYVRGGTYTLGALKLAEYGAAVTPANGGLNAATGYGVVGGNVYWQISGGTFSANAVPSFNGNGSALGDVYAKFVGHGFKFNVSSGYPIFSVNTWASTYQANSANKKYLDLSLVDSEGYAMFTGSVPVNATSNYSTFNNVYEALYDVDTISVTGNTYEAGKSPLNGGTLSATFLTPVCCNGSWNTTSKKFTNAPTKNSYTRTWEDVLAWDEYASDDAKTADAFEFNSNGNEITELGKFTTSVDMTVAGKTQALGITNPNIASVTSATNDEFGYLGVSLRPADSAIRVRAYVNETLRNRNLNTDGYVAVEYGVLLSKTVENGLTYGAAKVSKAIAFNSSNDTFFIDDGKYTFAAALYNIKPDNYNTDISFRPYIVLEDANGEQLVIYADMTGVTNFLNVDTIRTNLREVATYVRDNQVDFYNQNKKKIDAIIAG